MNKLINRYHAIKANKKKGFTLTELIVVILVIAVLMAALTPAITGVIRRAQVSADQADVRMVLMAVNSAAIATVVAGNTPDQAQVNAELDGQVAAGLVVDVAFVDGFAVAARVADVPGNDTILRSTQTRSVVDNRYAVGNNGDFTGPGHTPADGLGQLPAGTNWRRYTVN